MVMWVCVCVYAGICVSVCVYGVCVCLGMYACMYVYARKQK